MNSIREIALQRWLCQGVGAGRLARGRAARAAHPRCCHSASPLSLPVHHSMRSTRTRMCTAHTARAHVPWHCCSYLTCCFLSAAQVARSSGSLRTGATRRALGCSRPSHGGMLRMVLSARGSQWVSWVGVVSSPARAAATSMLCIVRAHASRAAAVRE